MEPCRPHNLPHSCPAVAVPWGKSGAERQQQLSRTHTATTAPHHVSSTTDCSAGRGRLPSGTHGAWWELALQGNRTWWELLPPATGHLQRPGGSARIVLGAGATRQPRRVGAVATGHRAPAAHRRELLPPGGSARMELEHAGLGLGNAHIEDEARGSRLGPDCTGDKTRGPELGLRPARTGDEAMDNQLGVGSARIGDETRGLGHGPGPARIGDKRRGLGLGFVLALLALRTRRWALGAVRSSVWTPGAFFRPSRL